MPIKRVRKSSVIDDASSIAIDDSDSKSLEKERSVSCKYSVPDDSSKIKRDYFVPKLLKIKESLSSKSSAPDDGGSIRTDSLDSKVEENPVNEKLKSPTKSRKKIKRKLPVRMARFRKPHSIRKYHDIPAIIPVIDLSDSEDTISSQGTLNSIIPHPTDFEGSNNPFLNSYKSNSDNTTSSDSCSVSLRSNSPARSATSSNSDVKSFTKSNQSSITSKNTVPDMPKSTSANSSESTISDIAEQATSYVSPKSTVKSAIKRDITSRRSCLKTTLRNITRTCSPKKPSAASTSASNILKNVIKNNRRLRSHVRLQKKCTAVKTGSVIGTLLNNSSPSSGLMSDKSIPASTPSSIELGSSLSSYFGADERLANGENCTVLAKRISPNGTVQYLVEWDTLS